MCLSSERNLAALLPIRRSRRRCPSRRWPRLRRRRPRRTWRTSTWTMIGVCSIPSSAVGGERDSDGGDHDNDDRQHHHGHQASPSPPSLPLTNSSGAGEAEEVGVEAVVDRVVVDVSAPAQTLKHTQLYTARVLHTPRTSCHQRTSASTRSAALTTRLRHGRSTQSSRRRNGRRCGRRRSWCVPPPTRDTSFLFHLWF